MSEPARSFQHYEVLRREDGTAWELGRGAMGITYKAFDVNLCCEVALKVVSSALVEHSEARERFVREARAAAALRHRNVASVYHLGNDGEHFFYAMEFINGETLDALVRRAGPLSVQDTLRVVLQVARALAAAARQNLVHRDIKPANLMVTHEDADEETVVKVIDFGLARAAANAENAPPLTIGGFVGTPQFASPEQLEERPLDARSDLYSLGVTAWFLLTGRVPFAGSLATVCQGQLTRPPPWEHLPANLPVCVRELLGRLLEKDPGRRPQTAVELRAELEACLDQVHGTHRKRDLHLPAPATAAVAPGKNPSKLVGRAPQAGTLLNGRYRLLRAIGGSRGSVSVYQARDESNAEKLVAVKILPVEPSSGSTVRGQWEENARLAQAAPHPNLVQILGLERSLSPDTVFLVEEWLVGPTLRDLLAVRGGTLPVAEVLRLLEQAAAAADHAQRCRLEHLHLGLTQWHLCFPLPRPTTEPVAQTRAVWSQGMAEWTDWILKTHAFRFDDDPLALDTWTGGDTLLPAARTTAMLGSSTSEDGGGRYVKALARLVYELLGGWPAALHRDANPGHARYALLPALNEEANLLLKQTLSGGTTFTHGWEWQDAFVKAIGGEPARVDLPLPVVRPVAPAAPEETEFAALPGEPWDEHVATFASASTSYETDAYPDDLTMGSAWDRLALVAGKRSHPGRWLAGIVGLAAVFLLVFVGVLASLMQQAPARGAVAPTTTRPRPLARTVTTASRPALRQNTPAPLVASALPPATAQMESTPTPTAAAMPRAENLPPTPVSAETPFAPAVIPPKERSTMVRVDSVPEGAQIRLGDEVLGLTPCRIHLPRGDHQLIARYQDWPETRQTVRLDGSETRLAVEIRMMRPDLVPGLVVPSSATPDSYARRIPAPLVHSLPPVPTGSPAPGVSEPEMRPAQRVLTPFRIDEAETPPPSAQPTPVATQPFMVDGAGGN